MYVSIILLVCCSWQLLFEWLFHYKPVLKQCGIDGSERMKLYFSSNEQGLGCLYFQRCASSFKMHQKPYPNDVLLTVQVMLSKTVT